MPVRNASVPRLKSRWSVSLLHGLLIGRRHQRISVCRSVECGTSALYFWAKGEDAAQTDASSTAITLDMPALRIVSQRLSSNIESSIIGNEQTHAAALAHSSSSELSRIQSLTSHLPLGTPLCPLWVIADIAQDHSACPISIESGHRLGSLQTKSLITQLLPKKAGLARRRRK